MRKVIVDFLQLVPYTKFGSPSTLNSHFLLSRCVYPSSPLSRTYGFSTTKTIKPELVSCHKL